MNSVRSPDSSDLFVDANVYGNIVATAIENRFGREPWNSAFSIM